MPTLQPPATEAPSRGRGSWPPHLHDALLAAPHTDCNHLAAHVCAASISSATSRSGDVGCKGVLGTLQCYSFKSTSARTSPHVFVSQRADGFVGSARTSGASIPYAGGGCAPRVVDLIALQGTRAKLIAFTMKHI